MCVLGPILTLLAAVRDVIHDADVMDVCVLGTCVCIFHMINACTYVCRLISLHFIGRSVALLPCFIHSLSQLSVSPPAHLRLMCSRKKSMGAVCMATMRRPRCLSASLT